MTLLLLLSLSTVASAGRLFGRTNNAKVVVPVSSSAGFAATATLAPPTAPAVVTERAPENDDGNTNVVVALVGFVKDSVVRTIDGCGTMWRNYGTCNDIRAKQKAYKQTLRVQYEGQGKFTSQEINKILKKEMGGISYDEFIFLQKGKQDRDRLTRIVFMSFTLPQYLPYMIMMSPDMLPSAFSAARKSSQESILQELSRTRSHAVLKTLLQLEKDAHVVPALAKMNIFGRKSQQRAMDSANQMGHALAHAWSHFQSQPQAQESMLDSIQDYMYSDTELTAKELNLVKMLPNTAFKGLSQVLDGATASPVTNYLPTFFARKKLMGHLAKVAERDLFLVDQKVDIESLSLVQLQDACQDRLVDMMKSEDELRRQLQTWLDLTVIQPRLQQGSRHYNANVARTALMAYHAMDATQSSKSASYLARTLYQAPMIQEQKEAAMGRKK